MFTVEASCLNARAGRITIGKKEIKTPAFMPVGTQGCVKALDAVDISEILKPDIILANTYHLYLRPNPETIERFGGLRAFTGCDSLFLTDSGGFQAFSLPGAKVMDEGIEFQSHIDGSTHFFTPEIVINIQHKLKSDIVMVLDDLVALPADPKRVNLSVERTLHWAEQSLVFHRTHRTDESQKIFAIVQGGTDEQLRAKSANGLNALEYENRGFDGFAIGGLSVGESSALMYETIEAVTPLLPREKPRYLMGVGTPENLIEAIDRGVDMFDCVMPSRNARNGTLFTSSGKCNIKRPIYALDNEPIDASCGCYTCRRYSKGYLSHLFRTGELTYYRLATLHNLHYYLSLMREARAAILSGRWSEFKGEFYAKRGKE